MVNRGNAEPQTHDRTPPLRNGFQTFHHTKKKKFRGRWKGGGPGGGMAGQARVAEEGMGAEVATGSRVVYFSILPSP